MLTPDETRDFRARILRAQWRRSKGKRVGIRLTGGPLDGLTIAVPEPEARVPLIGWCHVARTGSVQALYRRADDGTFTFERCTRNWPATG